MKTIGSVEIIQKSLFILFLIVLPTQAIEMSVPYLSCKIELSKKEIIAEEPVNILFHFKNTSDGEVYVSLKDNYNYWAESSEEKNNSENLKITVKDIHGNEIIRRNTLCRPSSQEMIISANIKPGETVTGVYPIHLRFNTQLQPGQYIIEIKNFSIYHGYHSPEYLKSVGSGVRHMKTIQDSFSGPSLKLNILPHDRDVLNKSYELLMKQANTSLKTQLLSWYGLDYQDIAPSVFTILWAVGPVAVSYQIEIMYDQNKGFRFWDPAMVNTWDNIVRYATKEQVEQVIKIAQGIDLEKVSGSGYDASPNYCLGMAWAIHQWNATGSKEIREITKELAKTLPEEEPCPSEMELGKYPYGK